MDTAVDSIKAQVPNRYSLVVLAAKRAKQIKEGAPPLIYTDNPNALSVALDEIAAGKIGYIEAVEPEDDEAPIVHAPAPAATVESAAMQMLTQSLAEAERAASYADDNAPAADDDDQNTETAADAEGSEEE